MPRALQKCRHNNKITGKGNSGKHATIVSHARSMEQGTTTCPEAATNHTSCTGYTSTLKQTGKGLGHLGTTYGRQVSLGPLALEALTFLKDLSREAGGTNASKGEMKAHRTGKSIELRMFLQASRPYSARATVTSC